jgi:osmotically-inducible protein OsmY
MLRDSSVRERRFARILRVAADCGPRSRGMDGHTSCVVRGMTKTDVALKQDIETELAWDPKVNSAQIGVSSGVRRVPDDLKVKIQSEHVRSDFEIARAVQSALTRDVLVPKAVTAKIQSGSVRLEGQVLWHFQRAAAERAVRYLAGVISVSNSVTIKPEACLG